MQMPMCSRCGKNIAVVFISKIENGISKHEGICLKCAKELGIKPVDGLMEQMGITEDDLESISNEMAGLNAIIPDMDSLDDVDGIDGDDEDDDDESGTTRAFPFLDKLFGDSSLSESTPQPSKKKEKSEKPPKKDKKRKFLTNYCTNLTKKANEGKIDCIVGRHDEIHRVIQILNRRQKNNPCLIGEPGVGKTAVAEGLALKIVSGDVPYKLKDKEVYMLDLTSLVAGTQFRGQFESRMKGLIEEIKALGNIILVIDEVHNIVGAGDAEGSMNAANILKPALSRGEIQVIGATTFSEYRKHIEKDSALERRFQPVTVAEPSIEDSTAVLKGIKNYYENYHGVVISDEVCKQAVMLSERYITDRFLPDKAIDLIDEACSEVNLNNKDFVESHELQQQLDRVISDREDIMAEEQTDESYAKIAELRSKELQLENQLAEYSTKPLPEVTIQNLAEVIELWTKIPASKICEQEATRLLDIEKRLKEHVVGQDEAITSIASAIRRSRAGISAKRKPVSFVFVGPTGVGKTELVKTLANDLFDSPEALIRLDMSEYMEKHAISRMIGSPPGYVGYDEAGQLTEKVRRKPYSVILFDEIEKAHPDVLNILLQILDDGHITDAHGRQVSFENTVIIMTSNAGSDRNDGTVGFGSTISQQGQSKAMKALSEFMRPEFINRIDEVIAFNQLTEDDFKAIAKIMLNELSTTLSERNMRLTYDEDVIEYIKKKSYSIKYGARNLRRTIEKEIEDKLATVIINSFGKIILGAHISLKDEQINIDVI